MLKSDLYVLVLIIGDSLLPVTTNKILLPPDSSVKACRLRTQPGFYAADPIGLVVKRAGSLADCALACLHHDRCVAGNAIPVGRAEHLCLLHSSRAASPEASDERRVAAALVENLFPNKEDKDLSVYFQFENCEQKLGRSDRSVIPAGKAGKTCGIPFFPFEHLPTGRAKRIVGGRLAAPYSQPWTGFMLEKSRHVCGASLIARSDADQWTQWALTAAHCFCRSAYCEVKSDSVGVVFGLQDIRIIGPHTVYRRVQRVFIHRRHTLNDIALVLFSKKVHFNRYVRPICLPHLDNDNINSTICVGCGWGSVTHVSEGKKGTSSHPKYIPQLKCTTFDTSTPIDETLLKYEGEGYKIRFTRWAGLYQGTSYGDSGGPIACRSYDSVITHHLKIDMHYILCGIITRSYRYVWRLPESYNVFTDVHAYMKWITNTMDENQ